MTKRAILPSSEANTVEAEVINSFLEAHSEYSELRVTRRLAGGYSATRVYLAIPSAPTPATNAWIIKVGPTAEIEPEIAGATQSSSYFPPTNQVALRHTHSHNGMGLIIYDYAGTYGGRPPRDLESVAKSADAVTAFSSVTKLLNTAHQQSAWHSRSLAADLKAWTAAKLPLLPPAIAKTLSAPVLYCPDLSATLPNIGHYLSRDIRHIDAPTPLGVSHGDLNLRNILFSTDDGVELALSRPILIDYRHTTNSGNLFTDIAKLEACIRYQLTPEADDREYYFQLITFLAASRQSLLLDRPPESIAHKGLQELWRIIANLRALAHKLTSQREGSEKTYWNVLGAYCFSTACYRGFSPALAHLAYLDACAFFGVVFDPRQVGGEQQIFPVHPQHSPPVKFADDPHTTVAMPMLLRQLDRGSTVLVVGDSWGRVNGVEPLGSFLKWIYKDVTETDAPPADTTTLGEILRRRASHQAVAKRMRSRTEKWRVTTTGFSAIPWSLTISHHYHSELYRVGAALADPMIRIETLQDVSIHADQVTHGSKAYFSALGDTSSADEEIAITEEERATKRRTLSQLVSALERRQRPISVLFWMCESLETRDLLSIMGCFSNLTVTTDYYTLSHSQDRNRDATLNALGILRIGLNLQELIDALGSPTRPTLPPSAATHWRSGDTTIALPDTTTITKGLLRPLSKLRALTASGNRDIDFLLGGGVSIEDIEVGKVVRRSVVDSALLPSIRAAVHSGKNRVDVILVEGRPGSGVSTAMLCAADGISREEIAPVYILVGAVGRKRDEISLAASLIAEMSVASKRPIIVFVETTEATLSQISALVEGIVEKRGEATIVVGVRRDDLPLAHESFSASRPQHITVEDSLQSLEWDSLARILKSFGFSPTQTTTNLAAKLRTSGHLLAAIYEATDRKNRKFRQIVAFEYHRHARDGMVQKAYRLICHLGAYGYKISQFWLLRALGKGRSLEDSARILARLSDDVVTDSSAPAVAGVEYSNPLIAPKHRLIAEEVLTISLSTPDERIAELCELIQSANMSSELDGRTIAELIASKGPILTWLSTLNSVPISQQYSSGRRLFEAALENVPLNPRVEVTIRQHFALFLRKFEELEEALQQAQSALTIEDDNVATLHVLGLVFESRAVLAWKRYCGSLGEREEFLAAARANEADALEFFRRSRESQPTEEYGFESEARFYRRKFDVVAKFEDAEIRRETDFQLSTGLHLIRQAIKAVPRERLREAPKTKARILERLGSLDEARRTLRDEVNRVADMIRKRRLMKALLSLAAEADDWAEVRAIALKLIEEGDHEPALHLYLDDALARERADAGTRVSGLRESAEKWNRNDTDTQVRFAQLLSYNGQWHTATEALDRVDKFSEKTGLAATRREAALAIIKRSLYHHEDRRFTASIRRLWKPYEGEVWIEEIKVTAFFRATSRDRVGLAVGMEVQGKLAIRIRGLCLTEEPLRPSREA